MLVRQLAEDEGVHRAVVEGVGGGPVVEDADVGDEEREVGGGIGVAWIGRADDVLDLGFDLGDELLGLFQARADRGADEDRELAGVGAREELGAGFWKPLMARARRPAAPRTTR